MPDLSHNSLQVIVYIGERMFSNPERPVSQSKNNDVFQSFRHFSSFLDIFSSSHLGHGQIDKILFFSPRLPHLEKYCSNSYPVTIADDQQI